MRLAFAVGILFYTCAIPLPCSSEEKCAAAAQAIQICDVLANASQYDGKEVLVRGLYRMVLHGSVLMGSACPHVNVNLRQAQGWIGDKHAMAVLKSQTKKDQFQQVDVVMRGKFQFAKQGQCFGQNGLFYEIEDVELLCAVALKPKS